MSRDVSTSQNSPTICPVELSLYAIMPAARGRRPSYFPAQKSFLAVQPLAHARGSVSKSCAVTTSFRATTVREWSPTQKRQFCAGK